MIAKSRPISNALWAARTAEGRAILLLAIFAIAVVALEVPLFIVQWCGVILLAAALVASIPISFLALGKTVAMKYRIVGPAVFLLSLLYSVVLIWATVKVHVLDSAIRQMRP